MIKKICFVLITLTTIVIFFYVMKSLQKVPYSKKVLKKPEVPLNIDKNRQLFNHYWENIITQKGTKLAYQEFKKTYMNKKPTIQHLAMHYMGELLYEVEGLESINICDSEFLYGCYHETFLNAVADNGIEITSKLDQICHKGGIWPALCQHGIGHGLIEYFGYHQHGLEMALNECRKLTNSEVLIGCAHGAIMGYLFPPELNFTGRIIRPLPYNNDTPYSICPTLTSVFERNTCYYSLIQWWFTSLKSGYEPLGHLCFNIENVEEKNACFTGIGIDSILRSNYNIEKTIEICKEMPSKQAQNTCISGAYWMIKNMTKELITKSTKLFGKILY